MDPSWRVTGDVTPAIEVRDLRAPYIAHLRGVLNGAGPLTGRRLVVDCANGATASVAPGVLADLGFDVIAIGIEPDGRNINLDCGSTHLEPLQQRVRDERASVGIAFDGDGDRVLFVDHRGRRVDGDAVMLIIAEHLKRARRLPGDAIVATVMSNIGLEIALKERGIGLVRCPVGDKAVMEEMVARGLALGGEQSGHVILAERLFTGDGMATALQILAIMAETGRELADLASSLTTYPQVLLNVPVRRKVDYQGVPAIADAVRRVEARLADRGRLLVRYSGTEPLLRIMLEGPDQREIRSWAEEIADAVRANLG
jgi:phosphoglucosamine mutase